MIGGRDKPAEAVERAEEEGLVDGYGYIVIVS